MVLKRIVIKTKTFEGRNIESNCIFPFYILSHLALTACEFLFFSHFDTSVSQKQNTVYIVYNLLIIIYKVYVKCV